MCILSGDGVWQVRDVDVEESGFQDESLCVAVLEVSFVAYVSEKALPGRLSYHTYSDILSYLNTTYGGKVNYFL